MNAVGQVIRAIAGSPAQALQQALFVLEDDDARGAARQLDGEDQEPGWPCPAPGPAGGRLLASWSYDTPMQRLPAGTGVPLPHGAVVLQVRADLLALGLSAIVHPRLELSMGAAEPGELIAMAGNAPIPSGQRRVEVEARWPVPRALRLWGVVPRMGSHGRVLEIAVVRGEQRTCAAYFGHWRATQEQLYRREQPVELRAGDTVKLTCTINAVPSAGDESACAAALYVVPVE